MSFFFLSNVLVSFATDCGLRRADDGKRKNTRIPTRPTNIDPYYVVFQMHMYAEYIPRCLAAHLYFQRLIYTSTIAFEDVLVHIIFISPIYTLKENFGFFFPTCCKLTSFLEGIRQGQVHVGGAYRAVYFHIAHNECVI